MRSYLATTLLLFSAISVFSQSNIPSKTLSYYDFVEDMSTSSDPTYVLRNAVIKFNPETDSQFTKKASSEFTEKRVVSVPVVLSNIQFAPFKGVKGNNDEHPINLLNLTFNERVQISETRKNTALVFRNCTFRKDIDLSQLAGEVVFSKSEIDRILSIRDCEMERLIIDSCSVEGRVDMESIKAETVVIGHNHFTPNAVLDIITTDLIELYNISASDSRIQYNKFEKTTQDQLVWISTLVNDKYCSFDVNEVACPVMFHDCVFTGRFALAMNQLDSLIGFHNHQFNTNNAYFEWPDLKGKIAGFVWYTYSDVVDGVFFQGFGDKQLSQRPLINRLMIMKQSLYNLYRQQGLISYANGVFVEIKDLETRIFEYDYRQDPSLKGYFDWKMNLFLKRFSAYGTDPVLAIIYAFKVILLFALVYFFFHNDWDILSRRRVQSRLKLFLDYFRRKEGMAAILLERERDDLKELEVFKRDYTDNKKPVPRLFTVMAKLHYRFSKMNIDMQTAYYKRTDFMRDEWGELTPAHKRWTAFVTGSWFLLYLLIGLILKALNAILLSINAFTTLGFGSIPTRGLPRYIVIVQGLIGWFLMTLFSVTLITQLLR